MSDIKKGKKTLIFRGPLKCSITFPILSIWVSGSSHGPTLLIIEQRMVLERHALVGARKRLCFSFGRSLNSYSDQQFSFEQLNFDKTLNFKLDLFSFVFYLGTPFVMQKGETQLFNCDVQCAQTDHVCHENTSLLQKERHFFA